MNLDIGNPDPCYAPSHQPAVNVTNPVMRKMPLALEHE
jgi:hypothetical protein